MPSDDARAPRARLQLLGRGDRGGGGADVRSLEERSERGHVLRFPGTTRPLTATDWYERGCELEDDAPAEAIDAYRRAIAARPDHAGARLNLGRLLHLAGDPSAAEAHYRRAIDALPEDPIAWFNLGTALDDRGRDEEALAAYGRALALDPALCDAHFNASRVCERLGRPVDALRHLSAYRRRTRQ